MTATGPVHASRSHVVSAARGSQRLLPGACDRGRLPGLAPSGNTGGTARLKSSRIVRSLLTSVQRSLTHAAKRFGKTVKLWDVDGVVYAELADD